MPRKGHFTEGDLLLMVQILTVQQTALKLKQVLKSIVEEGLPESRIQIFEIRTVRNLDVRKPDFLLSVDALDPEREAAEVNEIEGFPAAIQSKKVVRQPRDEGTRMIFPLLLATTSHLIVFDHPGGGETAIEPLFYSFGNLLELLKSKDLDPLTGFLNRYAFNRIMSEMAANPSGNAYYDVDKRPYTALAIMDLDHFKRVNDTFGHLIGDETLLTFSQELRTIFRFSDVIARYGGEEFIVILKEMDSKRALLVLERCRQRIEKRLFPEIEHITVSIGFAEMSHVSPPMLALDRADSALYYAKENGRNRVCSYETLVADGTLSPVEKKGEEH